LGLSDDDDDDDDDDDNNDSTFLTFILCLFIIFLFLKLRGHSPGYIVLEYCGICRQYTLK